MKKGSLLVIGIWVGAIFEIVSLFIPYDNNIYLWLIGVFIWIYCFISFVTTSNKILNEEV